MGIEAVRGTSGSTTSYGSTGVYSSAPAADAVAKVSEPVAIGNAVTQDFSTTLRNNAEEGTQKGNKPSEGTVKQAVSDINKKINPNTVAQYGFHDDTNRVTIKIVDKDSDKVIKEFPAEETLDMIAKVWELAGMFVDEKG